MGLQLRTLAYFTAVRVSKQPCFSRRAMLTGETPASRANSLCLSPCSSLVRLKFVILDELAFVKVVVFWLVYNIHLKTLKSNGF